MLERNRLAQSGQLLEDRVHVLGDAGVAGQQADVGVDLRGSGMVIARTKVCIAAQCLAFTPDNQHHFRMCFEADNAVNHLHAGLLQTVGKIQVGFFVETRAQFDHD